MKKLRDKLALKLIDFGLWIMDIGESSEYNNEDEAILKRLNKMREDVLKYLKVIQDLE